MATSTDNGTPRDRAHGPAAAAESASPAPAANGPAAASNPASSAPAAPEPRPDWADAALALEDGALFWGKGAGAPGTAVGEVCFNTAMTGYQEIMTDPSYAGQIVTFTFPHIGNVGTNADDIETVTPAALGCVLRAPITHPSNWRADQSFDLWLKNHDLPAITGIDTRRLTRRIRDGGAPRGVLRFDPAGRLDPGDLIGNARAWPGLEGMDSAIKVTSPQTWRWEELCWEWGRGHGRLSEPRFHVVAVDYGAKRNILRCLAQLSCRVTVVPATASAEDILRHRPDGIFLSNGPGDPAATGTYAVPVIRQLMKFDLPIFGICLGHQILGLALGGQTRKMHLGHRGANHPVKDLETGKVEITSHNHGFCVLPESLPPGVQATHRSLFDGTLEGLKVEGKPIFSVQYHPEASPGPHDSHHLFDRFVATMQERR